MLLVGIMGEKKRIVSRWGEEVEEIDLQYCINAFLKFYIIK